MKLETTWNHSTQVCYDVCLFHQITYFSQSLKYSKIFCNSLEYVQTEIVYDLTKSFLLFPTPPVVHFRYYEAIKKAKPVAIKGGFINGFSYGFFDFTLFGMIGVAFWFGSKLIIDGVIGISAFFSFFGVLVGTFALGTVMIIKVDETHLHRLTSFHFRLWQTSRVSLRLGRLERRCSKWLIVTHQSTSSPRKEKILRREALALRSRTSSSPTHADQTSRYFLLCWNNSN